MSEDYQRALGFIAAFLFAMFLGYRIAPNNWYHDSVQECLDIGYFSDRECFMRVAGEAYTNYLNQE